MKAVASSGPGIPAMVAPPGYARHIPAGSKLVFQMHYTPNGTPQIDQSEAGLVFADPATIEKEMQIGAVIDFQLQIPAGNADYRVEAQEKFEEDRLLYALIPHMHLRGKAFRFLAAYPNGKTEILLDVPKYDFNWQNIYQLQTPRLMPKGTLLRCVAHFDNSENNLVNPDPKQPVHFGEQTFDEMMVGMYYYALADQHLTRGKPRNKKRDGRSAKFDGPRRTTGRAGQGLLKKRNGKSRNGKFEEPGQSWRFRQDSPVGPEVGSMSAKKCFPLLVCSVCIFWLAARRGPMRRLYRNGPHVAKEYGGELTEQFNQDQKNLPVKIVPNAEKAVGLMNANTNEGILLVPSRAFAKRTKGARMPRKTAASACATSSCRPASNRSRRQAGEAKRLRIMKFKDGEGNEHDTLCLVCSVKHVEGDDWQLMVYSGDNEPLSKSPLKRPPTRRRPTWPSQSRTPRRTRPARHQPFWQVLREHPHQPQGEVIAQAGGNSYSPAPHPDPLQFIEDNRRPVRKSTPQLLFTL